MVGAALTLPVTTEIISDGLHIHDAVLRLLVKVKGPDQIVIVTIPCGLPWKATASVNTAGRQSMSAAEGRFSRTRDHCGKRRHPWNTVSIIS